MIKLINRKSKESLDVEPGDLIDVLLTSIFRLTSDIDSLREDLEDLTDFVEDNLD